LEITEIQRISTNQAGHAACSGSRLSLAIQVLHEPLFERRFDGGGVDEVQVGFAIGTVQADDQVVSGVCIEHVFIVLCYGDLLRCAVLAAYE
jgi:hypothetical protein